ncbi:MAG TPA: TrpB-like pyridoxal phosphate-dependent enzyme [Bauldia sp.]|nr:TrpB-like pyridoxal phosphate-dependent enzyme [Bauldia sp.]
MNEMALPVNATSGVTSWCNFLYDFPEYYRESTVTPDHFADVAGVNVLPQQPLSLMKQSNDTSRADVEIPAPVRDLYATYRPTLLRRAHRLEERLGTTARIYFKYEGANVSGSHKLNSAIAQAHYYKKAGVKHLITGTGAGQWGTALSYACKQFGLRCTVFMVGISYRQKPQRRTIVELFGGEIHESPSPMTRTGREAMERDPERIGSLAVATGEAIEMARELKDSARFAVGSGETCVLLHQTVIGNEAVRQMTALGDFPDYVVACMGAGSNFAGVGMPFLRAAKATGRRTELVAAEPVACPKLTRGDYLFDINDFSGTTPVTRMYTLGSRYLAPPIHAGGLRYHGTSAFLSALYAHGVFSARAIAQTDALGAGILFADCEGIIPAPESAHAIAAAMEIAREHKTGPGRAILINISGHGLFDLAGYEEAKRGALKDDRPEESLIAASLGAARARNDDVAKALAADVRA